MKKILLLGDVIQDLNLMEYPPAPTHNHQSLPKTMKFETGGGTRHLKTLIEKVVPMEAVEIKCPGDADEAWKQNAIHVFNVWKQFPKEVKDKNKTWRIHRIIGRSETGKEAMKEQVRQDIAGVSEADLLVIDNLGLGWLDALLATDSSQTKGASLAQDLFQKTNPENILLKMSSLNGGFPFADSTERLDKMTVVLSAHTLRERGAAISEGLSWDRTIEDTVQEFQRGLSSLDLARCRRVLVLFSAEGAAVFEREGGASKVSLQKFLFHPSEYEGTFKAKHPGQMSGKLSLVTAAVVRHLFLENQYPLFASISLTLAAIRSQQEKGIEEDEDAKTPETRFDFAKHTGNLCDILRLTSCLSPQDKLSNRKKAKEQEERVQKQKEELGKHLGRFSCAFPHDLLENYYLRSQEATESNLLRDATGYGYEYVAAKAFQIVMEGSRSALSHVPIVSYRNFLTADREEIERINAIRKLIISYQANQSDKRPLSLAVFGPPGSGKSFSIKELAAELGFADESIRTFNLSEFKDPAVLQTAFHIVRDAGIKGKIPLIFWDEFDSDNLKWLKEFLAPMQDSEFRAGSVIHPLSKAIFVFAGGVFTSFEEFEEKTRSRDEKDDTKTGGQDANAPLDLYHGKKAPDFISRLRGYVNIKGPNKQKNGDKNSEFLIRRAILFRSVLERNYANLLAEAGRAAVSAPVVQAFLRIEKYKHGARSLESIVTMSDLVDASIFGETALPPDHLLNLHVDAKKFREIIRQATLDAPMMELIAEACHEGWKKQKEADGYKWGEKRSDIPPKTHPLLVDYGKLEEKDKEGNRVTARVTPAKLDEVKLEIAAPEGNDNEATPGMALFNNNLDALKRIEHDIWMRDHLISGYEWSNKTEDSLKLHRCIARFDDDKLTEEDKKLDAAIVESLRDVLGKNGYGVKERRHDSDNEA